MTRVLPWLALAAAFGCAEDTRTFDAWQRDVDPPRPYLAFGECRIAQGSTCTDAGVEVLRETRLDADVRLTCVFAAAANTVSPLIDDPVCQAALQAACEEWTTRTFVETVPRGGFFQPPLDSTWARRECDRLASLPEEIDEHLTVSVLAECAVPPAPSEPPTGLTCPDGQLPGSAESKSLCMYRWPAAPPVIGNYTLAVNDTWVNGERVSSTFECKYRRTCLDFGVEPRATISETMTCANYASAADVDEVCLGFEDWMKTQLPPVYLLLWTRVWTGAGSYTTARNTAQSDCEGLAATFQAMHERAALQNCQNHFDDVWYAKAPLAHIVCCVADMLPGGDCGETEDACVCDADGC